MDLGYLVIAVLALLAVLAISGMRRRWNGQRDDYHHSPLPGHRQGGSCDGDGVE